MTDVEQARASWTTVEQLFHATRTRDADAMLAAYAEDAVIGHPLLGRLTKGAYAAALQVFLRQTPVYELTFQINRAGIDSVEAEWALAYVFQSTGRAIRTEGESRFQIAATRIVRQHDDFDRREWSRQALGFSGYILSFVPGWRSFLERELRQAFANADRTHV
jgi:ketosteroid isomerase-like protein